MSKKNTRDTFTTEELAKAFGISRSKILRLEDLGLISPHDRCGRANSRHYDVKTMLKLYRILLYHDLGYTYEETVRYFNGEEDYMNIIQDLENRIHLLTVVLSAMKNRTDTSQHLVVQNLTTVASHYYAKEVYPARNAREAMDLISEVTAEVIRKGYPLRYELPVTCLNVAAAPPGSPSDLKPLLCVPIRKPEDGENIIFLPREEKKCVHWFGIASENNYVADYLELLKAQGIIFNDNSSFRSDILTYPLDINLPNRYSWVLRLYLP